MTQHPPSPPHDSADHWLAYRYLTGELTDDEAVAVEARLATDLSLQTALADCVRLTTGLSHLSGTPAVRRESSVPAGMPQSPRSPLAWAGAVACLLVLGLLMNGTRFEADLAGNSSLDTSLVAVWSQLEVDALAITEGDRLTGHQSPADTEEDAEDDLHVPDWMLLAVVDEPADGEETLPAQEHQL